MLYFEIECIYQNEFFILLIYLFTYIFLLEKQKKGENVPGYTDGFFSFSSAI